MLVDAKGERLTPSHAVKKGRRYRYYVSAPLITAGAKDDTPSWRLAAQEIEDCVIRILVDALISPAKLLDRFGMTGMPSEQVRKMLGRAGRLAAALRGSPAERAKIVRELVEQVIVDDKRIIIKVWRGALLGGDVPSDALYGSPDISGRECTFYRRPRFGNSPYGAGEAEAQATAQSERTRPWLLANRFQAISQASMMSARLENTELASQ